MSPPVLTSTSTIPDFPAFPAVPITAVMFDLGNVLLHFDHRLIASNLLRLAPDAALPDDDSTWRRLIHAAETGALAAEDFLDAFTRVLGVEGRVSHADLANAWCDMFWRNDDILPVVEGLRGRVRLLLVSNTNALHLAFIRERFADVLAPFDVEVYSHLEQAAKPDPVVFRRALERAGVSPASCLYFDDIRMHVHAATELGIHAYQFVSNAGVRDVLAAHALPARGV